jgi:2-polyprenyl-3-methyl-5-hydroxy-6-metoxy-1,4-benzoquinol methylase
MGKIYDTLAALGVASAETRERFADGTRDVPDLPVWRDSRSGVIYIDDYFPGEAVYAEGAYRKAFDANYERFRDARRRLADHEPFVVGRRICDFGCGAGVFLRGAAPLAAFAGGVELEANFRRALDERGIPCRADIAEFEAPFDTIFLFHVAEHLEDPLAVLSDLRRHLAPTGRLVVEVPHAGDLLLTALPCAAFKAFKLWSQHLVLHTRDSLRRLLEAAGYRVALIEGRQQYGLANHMQWLHAGTPGGHAGSLSRLETRELAAAYEAALQKIDATDTLVAVADPA